MNDKTGAIKDLTGWQDTTHGDQNGPKATARFLGIGYNEDSETRDLLTIAIDSDNHKLRQYDLSKAKLTNPVDVTDAGAIFVENQGFFITAGADDVSPGNKIGLYDSLNLRDTSHFATVDTGATISPKINMALDLGNSETTQHVFVGATGTSSIDLYRVTRLSGNVTSLPLTLSPGEV